MSNSLNVYTGAYAEITSLQSVYEIYPDDTEMFYNDGLTDISELLEESKSIRVIVSMDDDDNTHCASSSIVGNQRTIIGNTMAIDEQEIAKFKQNFLNTYPALFKKGLDIELKFGTIWWLS